MQKVLTIPEWHRLAMEGTTLPVRILINGNSMFPLIRYRRDHVTIIPIKEPLAMGDIILFSDPDRNRYVIHRIWQMRQDAVLTWGDNCNRPDGWIPIGLIWGKVVKIERDRKVILPDPRKGIHWAFFWHNIGRGYRFWVKIKQFIALRIRKIINHT